MYYFHVYWKDVTFRVVFATEKQMRTFIVLHHMVRIGAILLLYNTLYYIPIAIQRLFGLFEQFGQFPSINN